MPRFFVTANQVRDGRVRIVGDDAEHLRRSLRVRPGETVVVVEDGSIEHGVLVDSVRAGAIEGSIVWSREPGGEPALRVHVLLALANQDMDDAVAELVVCGAASIRPVIMERSVVRDMGSHKMQRLRSVAVNAAQLSGRAVTPCVADPLPLMAALDALPRQCRILASVISDAATPLAGFRIHDAQAALVIGPEGGLTPTEQRSLRDRGATAVHLGPRTLPHHAAGAVGVTMLLAAHGDLDEAPR